MNENSLSLPLLSSKNAGWTSLQLEHHIQAAHEMPELILSQHVIEVGLRYDAAVGPLAANDC